MFSKIMKNGITSHLLEWVDGILHTCAGLVDALK